MKASNNRDNLQNGKIDWRIKVIAIPALIIFAFLLGLFVVGPWWRTYKGSQQNIVAAPIPPSPDHKRAKPLETSTQPKVDLEITENKNASTPSAKSDSNGVTADGNSITVQMEPGTASPKPNSADGQKEKSAETPVNIDTGQKPAELQKKDAAPANTGNTSENKTGTPQTSLPEPSTYKIQAGTFSNKASADRLASDLADHGYRVDIATIPSDSRTLYRVQVGEYKSRDNADAVVIKLKSDGYSPTISRVAIKR